VTKLTALAAVAAVVLGIAGCVSPQQQVGQKEDLLAAAGFQVRPADSPHRIAAMKRLPANRFVTRVRDGNLVYLYADPLDCGCLYLGTQQNWDAYKQEMFAKQIADQQQMTAIMNQESWDWGPWGYP
jgi:ABC-type sugar transport system substrate-binding protein